MTYEEISQRLGIHERTVRQVDCPLLQLAGQLSSSEEDDRRLAVRGRRGLTLRQAVCGESAMSRSPFRRSTRRSLTGCRLHVA